MINIKKLIFLFLSLVAFAMPVFAETTDPEATARPTVEGIDPKPATRVPDDTSSFWAKRIPSVTYVAGAYRELYENKVGDVVKVEGDETYRVNDGNVITGIDVSVIEDQTNQNLKTRRIQYKRDNVKIPVKDGNKTYDSTTYTTIWVE